MLYKRGDTVQGLDIYNRNDIHKGFIRIVGSTSSWLFSQKTVIMCKNNTMMSCRMVLIIVLIWVTNIKNIF